MHLIERNNALNRVPFLFLRFKKVPDQVLSQISAHGHLSFKNRSSKCKRSWALIPMNTYSNEYFFPFLKFYSWMRFPSFKEICRLFIDLSNCPIENEVKDLN